MYSLRTYGINDIPITEIGHAHTVSIGHREVLEPCNKEGWGMKFVLTY